MRTAYPIILTELKKGKYAVRIPDFDSLTEGNNLADAIYMARDCIGIMGITMEDDGQKIPKPFSNTYRLKKGETSSIVDIDFDVYRAQNDNKLIKKNCTIPAYLEKAASNHGLNFSRVLTEALVEKLGLTK